jgi:Xaa-Pro aminopeptidase
MMAEDLKATYSNPRASLHLRRLSLALVAIACACCLAQARFREPSEEYAARRAKLRTSVDGPIVLFGYTGHEDASEVAVFFQETHFYYLTGHDEPGAVLLLTPDVPTNGAKAAAPTEVLYLPARNPSQEKWEGPRMGPDDPGVHEKTGFADVEPLGKLKGDLEKLAETYKTFYTLLPPKDEQGYPHLTSSVADIRSAIPHAMLEDIAPALDAMRQVKSAGELALMQKAIDVSIDAQFYAMRHMRPGLFEYQVAARMKQVHEMGGCSREAYAPIVGAGFNSTVLHYSALDAEIKDGDLVVMDVGGEYGGYAADITRTVPANGKFTPRQREIYNIVLGAQNAAMAAVKPGAVLYGGKGSLQSIATDYINSHGRDSEGHTLGRYYPHGVSHHLGLDVHDPGDRNRPLEAGMVVTVEPGIYIPEENLGVRIEDDVLVTKDGFQMLTARLPRTADEIEKIMSDGRTETKPQE